MLSVLQPGGKHLVLTLECAKVRLLDPYNQGQINVPVLLQEISVVLLSQVWQLHLEVA